MTRQSRLLLLPVTLLPLLAFVLLWGQWLVPPAGAQPAGQTLLVNVSADGAGSCPSFCTLREAIVAANTATGPVTITFSFPGTTILLTSALPQVEREMTIDGSGVAGLTINGASSYRIFSISSTGPVHISNVRLEQGRVTGDTGSAIRLAQGDLTLDTVELRYNNSYAGGAIQSYDRLTITNSLLEWNQAEYGGALNIAPSGRVTLLNTVLQNNYAGATGGAVLNHGHLSVDGSTLAFNSSVGAGGALTSSNVGWLTVTNSIFNENDSWNGPGGALDNAGPANISASTFTGNSAKGSGGAITNQGRLRLEQSAFQTNSSTAAGDQAGGGAVYNAPGAHLQAGALWLDQNEADSWGGALLNIGGVMTFTGSSFTGNQAGGGGALYSAATYATGDTPAIPGQAVITNSTFSANDAGSAYGIVTNISSSLQLSFVTFAEHTAMPLFYNWVGAITLDHVVADAASYPRGGTGLCSGSTGFVSLGFNRFGDSTCQLAGPGDQQGVSLIVQPLADHGGPLTPLGPIPTHLHAVGSPALDAGGNCPAVDQRGLSRPLDADGDAHFLCDAGATEQPPPLALSGHVDPPLSGGIPATLTWQPDDDAAGYHLESFAAPYAATGTTLAFYSSPPATLSLAPGTMSFFQVRAISGEKPSNRLGIVTFVLVSKN